MSDTEIFDLLIIGGGVNGCGIARDAAGRGYSVYLAEKDDLAQATSSSSTKLFHGGLRYLEYFEFRLVKEALRERDILLRNMPHISWPMRFVLPLHKDMRFDSTTPSSKLLGWVMPWMRGRRPNWLIRLGLFLYDAMAGWGSRLPKTRTIRLANTPEGVPLQDKYRKAFEYSDGWVEDSRLVVLNARDAAQRGAQIETRTKVETATATNGIWTITLTDGRDGNTKTVKARMIVNAAGPWVGDVIHGRLRLKTNENTRLVRGSHLVVKRHYPHDKAYFFQGTDGRIIFAIPYEGDFTLIGTTDMAHHAPDQKPVCTPEEQDYLLNFANQYFETPITKADIVWTYSGVRPLYDDGAQNASALTRDYVLKMNKTQDAPVLNIFGGKITTFRKLAESALKLIDAEFGRPRPKWTANAPLPGGDFAAFTRPKLIEKLRKKYTFLDERTANRLITHYGTDAFKIFEGSDTPKKIAHGIYAPELDWVKVHEFVETADDFVWRRSRLGLHLTRDQIKKIDAYLAKG
ncbi:MAG: glycerol-3-phosphate dehydrogenase [Pseudomonadota bacterium]